MEVSRQSFTPDVISVDTPRLRPKSIAGRHGLDRQGRPYDDDVAQLFLELENLRVNASKAETASSAMNIRNHRIGA
jgi:hypothetical protein